MEKQGTLITEGEIYVTFRLPYKDIEMPCTLEEYEDENGNIYEEPWYEFGTEDTIDKVRGAKSNIKVFEKLGWELVDTEVTYKKMELKK